VKGAGGKLVAFLHPKSTHGVLTEFCSPSPSHGH
jgi:methylmalonyl-CoA/ethylmalonyl-CoA epimerase